MTESALRDQLNAAATAALVVDETDAHGVLVVRGGDRRTWLNGLVTCDMNKLAPGTALYGLAVTGTLDAEKAEIAEAARRAAQPNWTP